MDWLTPNEAKIIKELVTSFGILFGGGWAFWKWSLSEYFRHRHDIPSFDGEISCKVIPYSSNQNILSISCVWRNVGRIALLVNTRETRFTIYKLPHESSNCPVNIRHGLLEVYLENKPWEHWPEAILEPSTNSEIQSHFILESGITYVIVCRLVAVTKQNENKQIWVRELVWNDKVSTNE